MTIRGMAKLAWLLVLATPILSSCGDTTPPGPEVPTAVTEQISSLQDRIDVLETEAQREAEQAEKAADRLWAALGKLRKELKAGSGQLDAAGEAAQQALAAAQEAARDLAVLTDRYDYHLRRYHGGG